MKRVYRLFGIPVWSITSDEEVVEEELTAGDNGGGTYSDRIDVYGQFTQPQWDQRWDEERK